MNPHTSKIGRLPRPIREELNRRLDNGEPGPSLLAWLNHHPDVRIVLTTHFEGHCLNKQNLSAWRQSGFTEWKARQDLIEELQIAAGETTKLSAACGPIIDHL